MRACALRMHTAHIHITAAGGRWLRGLLPQESSMRTQDSGTTRIDDPTPPNGVKAPGKNEDLLQDGPAQDSEIDDDDGIEDDVDADEDE